MLNQFKTILAFAALLVFFTACGEHNQPAPNKGKNLDSERIYGESREAEPAQLKNKYEDPEGINDRSKAVYTKMYAPKEVSSLNKDYPVENIAKEEVETTTETATEDTTAAE